MTRANIERQLEELEVLQAIYPDEVEIDERIMERVKQQLTDPEKTGIWTKVTFSVKLMELASLNHSGKNVQWCHPLITIEFPTEYPPNAPPTITKTSDGLDQCPELVDNAMELCAQEHSGCECMMQLIMTLNEQIEAQNERTLAKQQQKQAEAESKKTKPIKSKQTDTIMAPIVLGRRIINSPYILKPAKIKDLKRCADELQLGGYAKVGKPGIIVIEGPEDSCQQYCPMLEDRGWKYQKVQGQQEEEATSGDMNELRRLPRAFRVLEEDSSVAELGQLCREAGLADLFFGSLNIHNSVADDDDKGKRTGKKSGKR